MDYGVPQDQLEQIRNLVLTLYKDENGKPLKLTDSQCVLFDAIFKLRYHRMHIKGFTRLGKSLVIALAVLTRMIAYSEKWAIVAGRGKQAKIIIGYIIDHAFDNEATKNALQLDTNESLDSLRRERSKNRLTFKAGGEVYVLSADSRNKQDAGSSLMGSGASRLILDEASLVDDVVESKIFRMLGDSMDNYYIKIGNPFFRNHFYKSSLDPLYWKLDIDYKIGIQEGRLTEEFIEEARKKPSFDVLYENKFPNEIAVDDEGYSRLFPDSLIERATIQLPEVAWFGTRRVGHDVARGGRNENVWALRTDNYATILGSNHDPDLMSTTGTTIRMVEEAKALWQNVHIDDSGIGGGETDRLYELKHEPNAVMAGARADDDTRFENRRAENYWRFKEWLESGGKLDPKFDWSQLAVIYYRAKDSSGKMMIMPKEKMKKRGWESPDRADAVSLTFDKSPYIQDAESSHNNEQFDPHSPL